MAGRSMVKSRNVAQQLIKDGIVFVNGKKADKPSLSVSSEDVIEIRGRASEVCGQRRI